MKKGVQQIMLGTVTSTEKKALETLTAVKRAGYDGLELNRFMIHESSLMVRLLTRAAGMPTGKGGWLDWHGLLKETGLEIISLHADLGSLEREGEAIAREAESFGTDKVVITGMYRFDYGSEDAVRDLALRLDRAGEKLKEAGMLNYICTINEANMGLQLAAEAKAGAKSAEGKVQVGMNFEKMMENRKFAAAENEEIFGTPQPQVFVSSRTPRETTLSSEPIRRQRLP